ncbi:uncharacterized protein LY89DRAFT_667627 [Mollisia scopiformis]|uniref:Uncharacterized protein n=1 Tax=Mollisia scopiformis TaxID=149040 RepID=A0A194XEG8_MOLSC|nr:uncharacterized protein LY89DRAFT_667627 [Mollisia scopiformis]KUJ18541.1 hypothetical protein LY89DRAFT_667627 [Mollisia scopiformis]
MDTLVAPELDSTTTSQLPQPEDIREIALHNTTKEAESKSKSAIVSSRIPRENGYGDFCFGRAMFNDRLAGHHDSEHFDYHYLNSVVTPQRRIRILRYLLGPYFKIDSAAQAEHLEVTLRPSQRPKVCKGGFDSTLYHYFKSMEQYVFENGLKNRLSLLIGVEGKSIDDWWDSRGTWAPIIAWFTKVKKAYLHDAKKHPTRSRQYEINVDILKFITKQGGQNQDWPMVELAWTLSNVSPRFRQEVGEVLWKHTKINVRFDEDKEWDPTAFFCERPAILLGIKSLRIALDTYVESDEEIDKMSGFCLWITQHPEIELFDLQIDLHCASSILDLLIEDEDQNHLCPAQLIKVTKSFEITWTYDVYYGYRNRAEVIAELEEKRKKVLPQLTSMKKQSTWRIDFSSLGLLVLVSLEEAVHAMAKRFKSCQIVGSDDKPYPGPHGAGQSPQYK